MFYIEMSKAAKINIPLIKPRNLVALSARIRKGGVHQKSCSRSAERQAWLRDWDDDLSVLEKNQSNITE